MDKYLGKRLDGRYEMRELIGVGGMAYVYKAYDAVDDRTVAVKILRDDFLTKDEFVRRFRNESKAIAILNHPNIVKVLDVGFGEKLQYIVMEYIDGITLKEYLDQRKDIRWKEAVHFTVQILRALQHAHDKGIVHRDIKPQNIMLLSDGTIKVTDFGIARLTRSEMQATAVGNKAIGSVHYISPEQARGEITDEKTDLYSVGIMLYEMLTGRLPFEADNAVSVAIMQMQSEATVPHLINGEIPEGLEQITLKAMQKDTVKRYQSAAEMLSDFDEFKKNPSIKFEYTYFEDETPTRYVDAITRIRGDVTDDNDATDEDNAPKNKLSLIAILGVATAAVVLIGVLFLLLWNYLNGQNGAEEFVVDSFIGQNYETVNQDPNYSKYIVEKVPAKSENAKPGEIWKQDPAPGSRTKSNKLTLYYAPVEKIAVPEIAPGTLLTEAESMLSDFAVKKEYETSDQYEKDTIIRIDPIPGTMLDAGAELTVYVSSGAEPAEPIIMPNIMGIKLEEAIYRLEQAKFINVKKEPVRVNDSRPENVVIATNVTIGDEYMPDTEIILTVSSGCKDVEIVVDLSEIDEVVDIQFFFSAQLDAEMSAKYRGIKPSLLPNGELKFTANRTISEYEVSIAISPAGANQYKTYAIYKVNAKEGVLDENGTIIYGYQGSGSTTPDDSTSSSNPTGGTDPSIPPDDDLGGDGNGHTPDNGGDA